MKLKYYGILHIPSGKIVYSAWGEEYINTVFKSLEASLLRQKVGTSAAVIIVQDLSYSPVIEEFEICELDDV